MLRDWEIDFDRLYAYVQGRLSGKNSYYRDFHANALLIYLAFGQRLSLDFGRSIRLIIKRLIVYFVGHVSLFWLSRKSNQWDFVVVITEPNHTDQFEAVYKMLSGKLRVLVITDKIEYLLNLYKVHGLLLLIPDGIGPAPDNKNLSSFLADIQTRCENGLLVNTIKSIIQLSAYKISFAADALNTIASKNKLRGVLVYNDHTPLGRIIVDGSNNLGIPSYYSMHGLLSDEYIEGMHICSKYFVYGEATKSIFTRRGLRTDQIEVVGSPYMDTKMRPENSQVSIIRSELKIPSASKVVLVALSGPGHTTSLAHHQAILKCMEPEVARQKEHIFFLFKLHKKDNAKFYADIQSLSSGNFSIVTYGLFHGRDTIWDWISLADVIVTGASTAGMEAMILSKPVVTIDLFNEYSDETVFIRQGATFHVTQHSQIQAQLERALLNDDEGILSNAKKFVAEAYFKLDGKAGERIASRILNNPI